MNLNLDRETRSLYAYLAIKYDVSEETVNNIIRDVQMNTTKIHPINSVAIEKPNITNFIETLSSERINLLNVTQTLNSTNVIQPKNKTKKRKVIKFNPADYGL